jgi:hypothetical protein
MLMRLGDLIEFAEPRYGGATLVLLPVTIIALVVWTMRRREAV